MNGKRRMKRKAGNFIEAKLFKTAVPFGVLKTRMIILLYSKNTMLTWVKIR